MRTDLEHRQRVKNRFCKEGLEHFDECHVLELLLFYAVPRRDTKPIARHLLDAFGSLPKVLEADMITLQKVEGVGAGVATYLHLLNESMRYCMIRSEDEVTKLDDLNQCGSYLAKRFHGQSREMMYLLCLDAKCKVICCRKLGEGDAGTVALSTRQVVELALGVGATSVVLAHNHPGGLALPSQQDLVATKHLGAALAAVDVLLADHIIVAEGDFISMVQSGTYTPHDYRLMLV